MHGYYTCTIRKNALYFPFQFREDNGSLHSIPMDIRGAECFVKIVNWETKAERRGTGEVKTLPTMAIEGRIEYYWSDEDKAIPGEHLIYFGYSTSDGMMAIHDPMMAIFLEN